jgi:hypothetical protein
MAMRIHNHPQYLNLYSDNYRIDYNADTLTFRYSFTENEFISLHYEIARKLWIPNELDVHGKKEMVKFRYFDQTPDTATYINWFHEKSSTQVRLLFVLDWT